MFELLYGGTGLNTTNTWLIFSGRHYRTFTNIGCFSKKLLAETSKQTEVSQPINPDSYLEAVNRQAFLLDYVIARDQVFAHGSDIINRSMERVHQCYSIPDHVFAKALDAAMAGDDEDETPVHVVQWLYDLVISPVKSTRTFKVLDFVQNFSAFKQLLRKWHTIYRQVRDDLGNQAHELEFLLLLAELANEFEDEEVPDLDDFCNDFVDYDPFDMIKWNNKSDYRSRGLPKATRKFWEDYRATLSDAPAPGAILDHDNLIQQAVRKHVDEQASFLSRIAYKHDCPLPLVITQAAKIFSMQIEKMSMGWLYNYCYQKGGVLPYQKTAYAEKEHMDAIYNSLGIRVVCDFDALLQKTVSTLDAPNPVEIKSKAPVLKAVTNTGQFNCVNWHIMEEAAVMAADLLIYLLGHFFDRCGNLTTMEQLIHYKAPFFARRMSTFFVELHAKHLKTPSQVYMVFENKEKIPLLCQKDQENVPREMGEHLVFQHYLYVFLWIVTTSSDKSLAGRIHDANFSYWTNESVRYKKVRF